MTFSEYKSYFEALTLDHVDVKAFHHGTAIEIIERKQDDTFDYVLAWLETPEMFLKNNDADNDMGNRRGALIIMDKYTSGDWDDRDDKLNQTEAIALQLIAKMKYDRREGTLDYLDINSFTMNSISSLFNDFETGWRIEFTFEANINLCLDQSKFTSLN